MASSDNVIESRVCADCGVPLSDSPRESLWGEGEQTCGACEQERSAAVNLSSRNMFWRDLPEQGLSIEDEALPWRERALWLLPRAAMALAHVDHAVTYCSHCGSLDVTLECWVDAVRRELRAETAELDGDSAHCETCDELGSLAFGAPEPERLALEGPSRIREWEAYAQRELWSEVYQPDPT